MDNLSVTHPKVSEKRLVLELAHLRDNLVRYKIKIFHIPGDRQIADTLTKTTKFSSALSDVLKTSTGID